MSTANRNGKGKLEEGQKIWEKACAKNLTLDNLQPNKEYIAISGAVKRNRSVLEDVIRIIGNNYFVAVDDIQLANNLIVLETESVYSIKRALKGRKGIKVSTYPEFVGASDD